MGAALFIQSHGRGGLFGDCSVCTGFDSSEWLYCLDEDEPTSHPSRAKCGRRRQTRDPAGELGVRRLEELTRELFRLHDLNGDGLLAEEELIRLNERIALLHHGKDTDTGEIRAKYHQLFRAKLDPDGRPVPFAKFRGYAREVLDGLDNDPVAQEMILEQFVEEARSGRQAFDLDQSDLQATSAHQPASRAGDGAAGAGGPPAGPPAGPAGGDGQERLRPRSTAFLAEVQRPQPTSPLAEVQRREPAELRGGDSPLAACGTEAGDQFCGRELRAARASEAHDGAAEAQEIRPPGSDSWAEGEGGAPHDENASSDCNMVEGRQELPGAGAVGSPPESLADGSTECGQSFAKHGSNTDSAVEDGQSDDTAPGDCAAALRCRSESSLDGESPATEAHNTYAHSGTLVVEQRSVRRATPDATAAEI